MTNVLEKKRNIETEIISLNFIFAWKGTVFSFNVSIPDSYEKTNYITICKNKLYYIMHFSNKFRIIQMLQINDLFSLPYLN